jgi:eukaryotic-like serine/threonine-protein kinase
MLLAIGQVINNRYRILSVDSQNRQEVFYSGWDISLNLPVNIQEIPNIAPDCVQRFGYEARRLSNLRHPSLPYVVDHFNVLGQGQYLILENVEGKDLQSLITESGKHLSWAHVVSWFGQVGDAVAFLHQQSPPIIHREVKPANIKIIPSGQAILVGNGISYCAVPDLRATFVPDTDSLVYLSPEFYTDEVDIRSDIYAFGATLYTALTGRLPLESLKRQAGQPMIVPHQLNPTIPPGIEQAIIKAMQLAPSQRYQSMPEMLAALGIAAGMSHANAPTVRIAQPENPAPTGAVKKSNGWIYGAIVVVLVVCLVGGILGGLGIYAKFFAPSETVINPTNTDLEKTATAIYLVQLELSTITIQQTETLPASATSSLTPAPTITSVPTQQSAHTWTEIPTLAPSATTIPSPSAVLPGNLTWIPCPGTYPSRLQVGIQAFVSYDPPLANRVHTQPNSIAPVVGLIQPGEKIAIIGGPICSNDWIWWQVNSIQTGIAGWTAEGDKTSYWLVPSQ